MIDAIRPFLLACTFAVLTIASSVGFGMAFGAFEDDMKGSLKSSADAVLATRYDNDADKARAVLDKSWVYFKRAHLHTGALGTQAMALTLLLVALTTVPLRLRQTAAVCASVGGLGYGWFWFFAGRAAPGLGGTGAAKESLAWLAQTSAALIAIGVLGTLVSLALAARRR
jgi:hypothetical protein